MPCTTILAGKKATHDGSTMIARTEDWRFHAKQLVVMHPDKQPRTYKTVASHLTLQLPDDPMAYTAARNVDPADGFWGAHGINEANVGMTATETITTNPRVQAADPMVVYKKASKRGEKDVPGGIGEEDLLLLVLPYIRSARDGVKRLGALLEQYGTYERNGIAFNDENEVWWFETIGGHHWMAKRVPDDCVVIMPNQLGIDSFDLADALGERKDHMCSADLKSFIEDNYLDLNTDGNLNPRWVFGSHTDRDHQFNTPRAWAMARALCPTTVKWLGEDALYTPESDDIPWAWVPEKKITPEDFKYILSTYMQGSPWDAYAKNGDPRYRTIACPNTNVTAICQIRGYMPDALKAIEWIAFGVTLLDAMAPLYAHVSKMPDYMSKVENTPSTENFCWASRILGAAAEPHFDVTGTRIERYQDAVCGKGRQLILEADKQMLKSGVFNRMEATNQKIADMTKKETGDALADVLIDAYAGMKIKYNRGKY
ncbi:MAG: C69 family dipeptidase [Firmicutes bacterium]|nr:C69 family dipeptidase [Bacillota bacterium]